MKAIVARRLNVVELHPEELLDMEARGELTASEAASLDTHCARCSVCRYERVLRGEFKGMLDGPDEDLSALEHVTKPHENGLIGTDGDRESGHVYSPAGAAPREAWWFGRKVVAWMSVAGMLVIGSHFVGANESRSAGVSVSVRNAREVESTRNAIDVSRASIAAAKVVPVRMQQRAKVVVASAATLFDEANRARVHGDYLRAHTQYERLQKIYPTSREANLSFVTMGRMQLDRADARGALASLERYEEGRDDELDAVVMACRALALDELGSERAPLAWAALLDTHPDTPYAQHARLRAAATTAPARSM